MVRRTRRSVLQSAAIGLTVIGAGCAGTASDETPSETRGESPAGTPDATAPPSEEPSREEPPDRDGRVDTDPPGSPALAPEGNWPAPRFDAGNTGWNPDGTGLRDGTTYWRLDAGGPASVADGTLYNTDGRDRDTDVLTFREPATAAAQTSSDLVEYGVNAPPVVADGRVYVTTFIEVFCFDAQSGEQLWRGPEMDGIQGQPTVAGGRVVVNSSGFDGVDPQVRAFDTTSGTELWRYGTGSNSSAAVADGQVFLSNRSGLHAVDLGSGEESFVAPDVPAQGPARSSTREPCSRCPGATRPDPTNSSHSIQTTAPSGGE